MKIDNLAAIPATNGGGSHKPDTVIIHAMAEFLEAGEEDFHAKEFLDQAGYSAHFLVCPSGVVIQTVPVDKIAWHARGHNTNSIGIEILVAGVHTYATFIERIKTGYLFGDQYTALIKLCANFKDMTFKRHSDVSPGRKVDPGDGLHWETFLSDVRLH